MTSRKIIKISSDIWKNFQKGDTVPESSVTEKSLAKLVKRGILKVVEAEVAPLEVEIPVTQEVVCEIPAEIKVEEPDEFDAVMTSSLVTPPVKYVPKGYKKGK